MTDYPPINLQTALAKLPLPATAKWRHGVFDVELMRHGTMSVIAYAPKVEDLQTPHTQDELYIVVSGRSTLWRDNTRVALVAGDVVFVPALMPHHFEAFSEDFVVWAVFWGPEGGERST